MSKGGRSLPSTLKALISAPTFTLSSPAPRAAASAAAGSAPSKQGRPSGPSPAPKEQILNGLFDKLSGEANDRGVGWGEWMSIAVSTSCLNCFSQRHSLFLPRTDRNNVHTKLAPLTSIPAPLHGREPVRPARTRESRMSDAGSGPKVHRLHRYPESHQ